MENDTAAFVDRALARLPEPALPPGLSARIMAAYDRRQKGVWARICEMVWPGAPLWAPASAFAGALLLGITLGTVLPSMGNDGAMRFSLDQPATFSLGAEEDL